MLMMLVVLCGLGKRGQFLMMHHVGLVGAAPPKRPADAHDAGHLRAFGKFTDFQHLCS